MKVEPQELDSCNRRDDDHSNLNIIRCKEEPDENELLCKTKETR